MGSKEESKILIFGGTGFIGRHMVKRSIEMGHPTFIYVRPITPNTTPSRIQLRNHFQSMGVTIFHGELEEHDKLVSAIEQVDIVISTLPVPHVLEQLKIIDAIKVAGNIKRFIPSDFGCDEDKVTVLPPFQNCLDKKKRVRRATEAAGIAYTYISSICCGAYFLNHLFRPDQQLDYIPVYGTGEAKVVYACEKDVATYTIKVANDPRACNRTVFYRPPETIISQLELILLWEKKTGQTLKRVHVSEEEIMKAVETSSHPDNVRACVLHSIFVKGDLTNFVLEEDDVEVSKLYPDFEYTTVDQLLDSFVADPPELEYAEF